MENGFIKENNNIIDEKTDDEKNIDLIRSVIKTKIDLDTARSKL